jgi:hypothetical protein
MSEEFSALTQEQKRKFWRDIQTLLSSVLEQCAPDLPVGVVVDVRAYLDHNELGLAWETLCEELLEVDVVLESPAQDSFLEAGRRMGFAQPSSATYDRWRTIITHFTAADLRDAGAGTD